MRRYLLDAWTSWKKRLYPLASRFTVRVSLVVGPLSGSGDDFRLLLVGDDWFLRRLMSLFPVAPREVWRAHVPWPLLRVFLRWRSKGFDFAFATLSEPYQRVFLPSTACHGKVLAGQILDVADGWEGVRSRFSRQVRKDTNDFERKRGFRFRHATSVEEFDFFYDRMFLPYVKNRFGKYAALIRRERLRSIFDEGFLFLVEKDGVAVAGQLGKVRDGVLEASRIGILDGDPRHVRAGAMQAAYYHCIRIALDRGCKEVDVGGSGPFLSNGALRHKAEWGAKFRDTEVESEWFHVFTGADPRAARPFLSMHPTVILEGGRLCVLAAARDGVDDQAAQMLDQLRRWRRLGLDAARVITEHGWRDYVLDDRLDKVESPEGSEPAPRRDDFARAQAEGLSRAMDSGR